MIVNPQTAIDRTWNAILRPLTRRRRDQIRAAIDWAPDARPADISDARMLAFSRAVSEDARLELVVSISHRWAEPKEPAHVGA